MLNWDRACQSPPLSPPAPGRMVENPAPPMPHLALRYISGGLAVSADEASWVITTYLVANSIVLCASGWIAEMFGRKNFFLVCIALFTASSLLCGFAWNLQSLLVFRVIQGLAGGGMTPVAQSILAAAFPPGERRQGFGS